MSMISIAKASERGQAQSLQDPAAQDPGRFRRFRQGILR